MTAGELWLVPVVIVSVALTWSGLSHLRSSSALAEDLARQGLPPRVARVVSPSVAALELVAGLGALASGFGWRTAVPFVAASVLFASYTLWLRWLMTARPEAPCGCGGPPITVSGYAAVRAAAFGAASLVAAMTVGRLPEASAAPATATAVLAGLAFAVLLWNVPLAHASPIDIGAALGPRPRAT